MRGMTEDEFDKACNFLLEGLRDMFPQVSKELTKEVSGSKFKGLSKRGRKVKKIQMLYTRSPDLISQVFAKENAQWAAEQRTSVSNFFDAIEDRATPLNPMGEITGGNYTSGA